MSTDLNVNLAFSWKGPCAVKEAEISRIDLKIGESADEVWALIESESLSNISQPLKFSVKAINNPRASLRLREDFPCTLKDAKNIKLSIKLSNQVLDIPISGLDKLKAGKNYIIKVVNGNKGLIAKVSKNEILSLSDDSSDGN